MTTQTLPLNLIPKGVCPRLYVSQYDKGQTWYFDLYAGTEAYTIPSEASVTIQGTKPDKTGFQYACSFSGNRVEATEQQQMTVIAGEVPAEIRIEKDNEIIATLNFIIAVEKAALAGDTVISETDLPLIEEAIEVLGHADELVQRIEGDVTTSGNNALKAEGFAVGQQNGADVASGSPYYHNSAKYYKEQAADSASTASNKASDASGSASAASGSASSASANALKAEGFAVGQQNGADVASGSPYYHNSAKYYKEQAADSASTASTKAGEAAASAQAAAQSAAHLIIDSAMSTTSQNAVQNKVVTGEINSVKETLTNQELYIKGKNKLVTNSTSKTESGVTYTNIGDGTVICSGTQTGANAYHFLSPSVSDISVLPRIKAGGSYTLTGGKSAAKAVGINLYNGSNLLNQYIDDGSGVTFTIPSNCNKVAIYLYQPTSGTAQNETYQVMLRDSDISDSTWEPIYDTIKQLTTDKVGMDLLSEVGAVNALNITAVTKTVNEVTFTVASDKHITATFSTTLAADRELGLCNPFTLDKPMRLSGCPSGGGTTTYRLFARAQSTTTYYNDDGDGVILPAGQYAYIKIVVRTGATSPVDFYPMITPVEYTGPYVPYAKSNKELTEYVTPKSFDLSIRSSRVSISNQRNFIEGNMAHIYVRFTYLLSQTDAPILTIPNIAYPKNTLAANCICLTTPTDATPIIMVSGSTGNGEVDAFNMSQDKEYVMSGSYYLG